MYVSQVPMAIKILIAGGFGAGKTTLVGSISETRPLRTEESISGFSAVAGKTTTTVAMDYGRLTIRDQYTLYLFGTPGQERFWFVWDELASGAIGAVVLADVHRLADCFPAVDYFEQNRTPFIVALNRFEDLPELEVSRVRQALDLPDDIPIVLCDARRRESGKEVLIALLQHALTRNGTPA
ncbi:GTP-binding protein [Nonomuraea sp. NPDC050663]|uniref:GTP-binding protein n=1 Tax=Nonomuraea sp. NPDC050663 TaxID=3364370 RepID=UPI003794C885